jgi:PAS domain-containing protein
MASQFHHLLGAVRHPLIAVDRAGVITDCNDVAADCLGAAAASVRETPLWEFVHPRT